MPEQPPRLAERLLRRLAPGGERRFRIEPAGAEALAQAKDMLDSMWKGVRLA